MDNIRWVSKLCLVVAIALELGAIFINLREGESVFYLFDLAYKFSIDNNFFLVYWGAIIGIFFFLSDITNKSETMHASDEKLEDEDSTVNTSSKLEGNIESTKSNSSKKQEREYSLQREKEFVKEEVRKTNLRDVTWEDKSLSIGRKPIQSYLLGDKPSDYWFGINKINKSNFNTFMSMKSKDYRELRLNPIGIVNQYQKWLITFEGKFYSRFGKKGDIEPPKKNKSVTKVQQKKETTEDKLKKLKDLYDKELISKEVYEKQQLEILSK